MAGLNKTAFGLCRSSYNDVRMFASEMSQEHIELDAVDVLVLRSALSKIEDGTPPDNSVLSLDEFNIVLFGHRLAHTSIDGRIIHIVSLVSIDCWLLSPGVSQVALKFIPFAEVSSEPHACRCHEKYAWVEL
jgi:hypothetical protein